MFSQVIFYYLIMAPYKRTYDKICKLIKSYLNTWIWNAVPASLGIHKCNKCVDVARGVYLAETHLIERIILDCIILRKDELGWKEVHNYIKFPTKKYGCKYQENSCMIKLRKYHDTSIDYDIKYEHPYVERIPALYYIG